jgi:cytochrome c oxidase cbb3-type subunit 1
MSADEQSVGPLARSAARHSLGWLVAGNLVGLWLALVLLWPALGDLVAPLTYGRWVPLHLDWHLYGWTALPVVGVMLGWFLDESDPRAVRQGRWALRAWTAALVLGGVSWLTGHVSGKLFLDWEGAARPLLPVAMQFLWVVLAWNTLGRWAGFSRGQRAARAALLALLLPVPAALYWAMGAEVYPAVNPDSGGATGAALLGSTLGIVTIFLLVPAMLGVARRLSNRSVALVWGALAASWAVFAWVDHGHTSHHALTQIAALAVLVAWVPLLGFAWGGHAWSAAARPWMAASVAWWSLLVISGWFTFLPGFSESLKFTHGLVAHAHLAMAGVVTSVNGLMLTTFTRRAAPRGVLACWHGGCALYVASMLVLGAFETEHAGDLFRSELWTQALLGLRLVAGALMLHASAKWLLSFWKP